MAGALVLVAVVVTGAGWLQAPPPLTAAEAVSAAGDAFAAAGLPGVELAPLAQPGTYEADGPDGPDGKAGDVAVWKVLADTGRGPVELWLARDDGDPVFLDDRSPSGSAHLLTDSQVAALGEHRAHPHLGRRLHRNVALTVAAALVAAMAARLAALASSAAGAGPAQPRSTPSPLAPRSRRRRWSA